MGPHTALAISFSGILGIYLECLRPGRVIAGCLGIALLFWGAFELHAYRPTTAGCLLLALAALLFAIEALFNTRFLAGVAATGLLFAGFKVLLPVPHGIHPAFALCLSVPLGTVTALLCASARVARRNKWSDLARR